MGYYSSGAVSPGIFKCKFNRSVTDDIKKMMISLQNKFKSKDSFAPNRLVELLNQSIFVSARYIILLY